MLKIKKIIIHEDFNINNLENDIALIEVTDMKDQPLDLEKSDYLKKLCLPDGEQPDVGTKCFLAGWGYTEDGLPSDTLKHVDLDINDMDRTSFVEGKSEKRSKENLNKKIMIT